MQVDDTLPGSGAAQRHLQRWQAMGHAVLETDLKQQRIFAYRSVYIGRYNHMFVVSVLLVMHDHTFVAFLVLVTRLVFLRHLFRRMDAIFARP